MGNQVEQREQEIFCACLELNETERSCYLKQFCQGDADFRTRMERMIAAHQQAEREGERCCILMHEAPVEIGPYRIIRLLGEGGMAVVYEADQTAPMRRRVALKIVKFGMNTPHLVSRFLAERQALAAMDHAYVAKVFDAGQTNSGRPYFVMELVNGTPLAEYCEQHRLSIRHRVELFVLICQAVQHAHQKG